MELSVYEAAGGRMACLDLAHAWHQRYLQDDADAFGQAIVLARDAGLGRTASD